MLIDFFFHCSLRLGVQSGPCEKELIHLDEAYVHNKYKVNSMITLMHLIDLWRLFIGGTLQSKAYLYAEKRTQVMEFIMQHFFADKLLCSKYQIHINKIYFPT